MNEAKKKSSKGAQLIAGLFFGIIFGFLLQKGGATSYDVILGQLLLKDFTVVKIMLSAVVTGMIGVYVLKGLGMVSLLPKPGSFGMSVIGGLLFGVGFALLGYCPGTISGAVGDGHLDAALGGVGGILIGSGLFAALYPKLSRGILKKGYFGTLTFPEMLRVNAWFVVVPVTLLILFILYRLESSGL